MNNESNGGIIFGGQPLDNFGSSPNQPMNTNNNVTIGPNTLNNTPNNTTNIINNQVAPVLESNISGNVNSNPTIVSGQAPTPVDGVSANTGIVMIQNDGVIPTSPNLVVPDVNATVNHNVGGNTDAILNFELPGSGVGSMVQDVSSNFNIQSDQTNPIDGNNINPLPNPINNDVNQNNLAVNGTIDNSINQGGIISVASNSVVPQSSQVVDNNVNQVNSPVLGFDLPNNTIQTIPTVEQNTITVEEHSTGSNTLISNEVAQDNISHSDEHVVSCVKYLGYLFLFIIPVVGFIMMIVKSLDKKDKNISNFAKAMLIFSILIAVLIVILTFVFSFMTGVTVTNLFNSY